MSSPRPQSTVFEFRDLAPSILRQRLVVEGTRRDVIRESDISAYLSELSDVCEMRRLIDPVTHRSDEYGWAGWIHWETSGAHFYAWDRPEVFFSVDIYTCRAFDAARVVEFTERYFETTSIVAREF